MTILSTLMKMAFHARLAQLRKGKGLTQQALANAAGLNVSQLKRYETGVSQPALDALRKLAVALGVSSDLLLFDKDERGPDDELRLLFEAVTRFDKEAKRVAKALLESLILKQEAKRWSS
jgi:transcriptional regulator with XRE-family HTH domain